jgi:hypothetical protein
VKNTADANSQRRRDSGLATLRNASPQNVRRVRAGRQIERDCRGEKQSEIMDTKHVLFRDATEENVGFFL